MDTGSSLSKSLELPETLSIVPIEQGLEQSPSVPIGWKLLESPEDLPKNWRVLESNRGRIVYESPPPRIKIQTRNQLLEHQKTGRFLELDSKKISFLKKQANPRKKGFIQLPEPGDENAKEKANSAEDLLDPIALVESAHFVNSLAATSSEEPYLGSSEELNNDFSESGDVTNNRKNLIDHELEKIHSSVELLTLNPDIRLDHQKELMSTAKLLNDARNMSKEVEVDFDKLKSEVLSTNKLDSCLQIFWQCSEARAFFKQMEQAVCLEELIHIGRSYVNGPLQTFPPDINQNLYSEIIKFGLEHSRNTLLLLKLPSSCRLLLIQ